MIQHGSVIMQTHSDASSVWQLADRILGRHAIDHVLIQEELVDLQKPIRETAAGQTLRYALAELQEQQTELARE